MNKSHSQGLWVLAEGLKKKHRLKYDDLKNLRRKIEFHALQMLKRLRHKNSVELSSITSTTEGHCGPVAGGPSSDSYDGIISSEAQKFSAAASGSHDGVK